MRRAFLCVVALMLAAAPLGASASPIEPYEPPYSVPASSLAAAVSCPAVFGGAGEPLLLVHGTATTAQESWGSNWLEDAPDMGFDVCAVELPAKALGDIQVASEYVVYAIRLIAAKSQRKVDVLGHSQGGLEIRWAVRWWPTLRFIVDDVVALATPNHGASGADLLCPGACAPAVHQQKSASAFLRALNSYDETPGDIDYTNIYTMFDELVQPTVPVATSATQGASNVLLQDVCPARPVHHVGLVYDAVAFALVLDALTHPGATSVARIDPGLCLEATQPGVSVFDAVTANVAVYGNAYVAFAQHPPADSEPPLKPYAVYD